VVAHPISRHAFAHTAHSTACRIRPPRHTTTTTTPLPPQVQHEVSIASHLTNDDVFSIYSHSISYSCPVHYQGIPVFLPFPFPCLIPCVWASKGASVTTQVRGHIRMRIIYVCRYVYITTYYMHIIMIIYVCTVHTIHLR
jgi:hypothetical protein